MKQHPLCTDTECEPDVLNLPVPSHLKQEWAALQTRRHFLGRTGKVLGWAAMASLLGDRALRGDTRQPAAKGPADLQAAETLKLPHFAPKAKRAIYLFMSGGPPQIDLLDYKPNLAALYDKDIPDSVRGGQQLTGMTAGQARFPSLLRTGHSSDMGRQAPGSAICCRIRRGSSTISRSSSPRIRKPSITSLRSCS